MAEARVLEARERHPRRTRKRKPLEKSPGENLLKEAERWMAEALRLRNTDPQRAARAADRAFGIYFSASKTEFDGRKRADFIIGAGKARALAASLFDGGDPRRASRMHEEAGDHLYNGAMHGTRPPEEIKRLAREQYELALLYGGNRRVLERKIGTCERA